MISFLGRRTGQTALALAVVMAALSPQAGRAQNAARLNVNLIVNGNAEAGQGAPDDGDTLVDIPGWTREGKFQVVQYGASGGFPTATDPGPKLRGKNFFIGGPDNDSSRASQTIDVSALATLVAHGKVKYTLLGYLGGYESQDDHTVLSAEFEDGEGKVLQAARLGPVTAGQRHNKSGLSPRSARGFVPMGTQKVVVTLTMTRSDGSYNDGSADNLSLIFDQK